jgi:formate dehydrogenase major subunit
MNDRITIDGIETEITPGETILSAAGRLGIEIPTLCFMEGRSRLESCGVCMVEVESLSTMVAACAARALPGMVVYTDTPAVREARKAALEFLLSEHVGDCVAPCESACPAGIDIPGFLRHIRDGNPRLALEVMRERVAFPGVLGRICPAFCEKVCRRAELDEAISICPLKRFPADIDQGKPSDVPAKSPRIGPQSVAVVGAGIAGLTAAYYLARDGHACTMYESGDRAGGALTGAIPRFRLPNEAVDHEIGHIHDTGVRVEYNRTLGRDVTLDELRKKHNAVLLATGAGRETQANFAGSEHARSCLDLLGRVARGEHPDIRYPVVVAGNGPGVLDACRTFVRLGEGPVVYFAETTRGISIAPQIDDARHEGVEMREGVRLESVEKREDGMYLCRITGENGKTTLEAGMVVVAHPLENDLEFLRRQGLETTESGVKTDRVTSMTNIPGVFAAGSVVRPGLSAVHSSESARRAAESLCRFLAGTTRTSPVPINVRMRNISDREKAALFKGYPPSPRRERQKRSLSEAGDPMADVDLGFSDRDAVHEASRCLQCDCTAKEDCSLRILATDHEASPTAYGGEKPPFERDGTHELIDYEPGKCIKCGRCISIAEEMKEPLGLSYISRGFRVKVGIPFTGAMRDGLRKAALRCADACPTGALARKRHPAPSSGKETKGNEPTERSPE